MAETTARKTGLSWEDLCRDPHLQDLPYKIETNEWGQIVMSPTFQWHGAHQAEIARLLSQHLEGRVVTESAIQTAKGTKVADVAWFSAERWEEVKDEFDASIAPEICVEVLSPTNAPGEMKEKKHLYFEAGAEEVWTCDGEGRIRFFTAEGERNASAMAPAFPKKVEL